jgi:hypothetical protein
MSLITASRPPAAPAGTPAAALLALIAGCANPGVTRQVLMVRVAELPPDLARPQHIRLIEAALDPLRNLDRASLFHLADDTLVMAWRGAAPTALAEALAALEQLFADLPMFPVTTLSLPRDAQRLTRVIDQSWPGARTDQGPSERSLDPAGLAALETALARANLAHFVHRRQVCRWPADGPATLAWERRRVSVRDLSAMLVPGVDVRADRWLFRRLTRSLDRCMLALLSDPEELRDAGPFAIDLNVSSVLGPEFVRFDATLPRRLRGEVVIGLLPADILADATSFALARDFARTRGYRILLRGVTPAWIRVVPPALLGADLIELGACPAAGQALPQTLAASVVLSQVNDGQRLAWGMDQGITLFEGSIVHPDPQTLRPLNLRRRPVSPY